MWDLGLFAKILVVLLLFQVENPTKEQNKNQNLVAEIEPLLSFMNECLLLAVDG